MKITTPTMRDGGVLALEIGRGAFAHRGRDFLHAGGAGIGGEQAARRDDAVNDREQTATTIAQRMVVIGWSLRVSRPLGTLRGAATA